MAPGDDDPVGRQQVDAVGVEVLVGDDVAGLAPRLEPVHDVHVDVEVPQPALWTQVQDRPMARDAENARAVGVGVVAREAQLPVLVEEDVLGRERGQPPPHHLVPRLVAGGVAVSVDDVGRGGHQDGDVGARLPRRGHDEEGYALHSGSGPAAQGVDAAPGVVGDLPGQIGVPPAVEQIVLVEVDGVVLGRIPAPVEGVPTPEGAGHRSVGQVLNRAVQRVRTGVRRRRRLHREREVPVRDALGRRRTPGEQGFGSEWRGTRWRAGRACRCRGPAQRGRSRSGRRATPP